MQGYMCSNLCILTACGSPAAGLFSIALSQHYYLQLDVTLTQEPCNDESSHDVTHGPMLVYIS